MIDIAAGLLSPARQRRVRSRHSIEAPALDFEASPPAAKVTRHSRAIGRRAIEHTSTPPKPSETRPEAPAQQYTKETCDVSKVLVANMGNTELLQSNGNTLTTPDSATLGRSVDNTKRMNENAGDQNNASNSAEDTEMEVDHEKKGTRLQLEIQWVGYPATSSNTSLEPEAKLKKICPKLLEEYWERQGGREKYIGRRGRPRRAH
ncbi:hypothetical protein PG991_009376 [Apiospora marii]|uniref:Chromo domain-containing protein n=1 Tax=Apiospora marii TaxID=335849 RepID=A0ABR1RKS1_9PEZI